MAYPARYSQPERKQFFGTGPSDQMSETGQKAKYSQRAIVVRCCPDSGHVATAAAFPFRAKRRHARDLLQPLPAKKEMLLPIEGSVLVSADGVSVDEMVDSVQSDESDNDKVDGNDVIQ
jgi:hypothetical protein